MTGTTGSIELHARRTSTRTVLERIRYDGISRCSRAFAQRDAALVMLSQLGPGVVRGDRVTLRGQLEPSSHLIVTAQSATRIMGGARPAQSVTDWSVADDATLELIGEPLIAGMDARYNATTRIELGERASVLFSEVARVPDGAQVMLRTSVTQGGQEIFYDAVDPARSGPLAIGTFAVVGLAPALLAAVVAELDTAADAGAVSCIGIGALERGAVARLLAPDVWTVQVCLHQLRALTRALLDRAAIASRVTRRPSGP